MLSLLSILRQFLIVMRAGWSEPAFRGLSMVLGGWLALGTIVYSLREGDVPWSGVVPARVGGQCSDHAVMSSGVATCPSLSGSGMSRAMERSLK
jgi:hypothetical protein